MKKIYTKINNIINLTSRLRAVTSNGMINNIYKKNNKGFTLVETMVAVLILTITIVSLMTVVANSLFAARYARDEITASYLLQEAIDYIRNDRDSSVFLQTGVDVVGPWNTFVAKYALCNAQANEYYGCYIDVSSGIGQAVGATLGACSTTECALYYHADSTGGVFYNYNATGGVKTSFKRQILVVPNVANDGIDVTVTVSWKNGGLTKTRSLDTTLMNWQI